MFRFLIIVPDGMQRGDIGQRGDTPLVRLCHNMGQFFKIPVSFPNPNRISDTPLSINDQELCKFPMFRTFHDPVRRDTNVDRIDTTGNHIAIGIGPGETFTDGRTKHIVATYQHRQGPVPQCILDLTFHRSGVVIVV